MERETYLEQMKSLRKQEEELRERYIKEHTDVRVGDKIKIDGNLAHVVSIEADHLGFLIMYYRKYRADGSQYALQSKVREGEKNIWNNIKIVERASSQK